MRQEIEARNAAAIRAAEGSAAPQSEGAEPAPTAGESAPGVPLIADGLDTATTVTTASGSIGIPVGAPRATGGSTGSNASAARSAAPGGSGGGAAAPSLPTPGPGEAAPAGGAAVTPIPQAPAGGNGGATDVGVTADAIKIGGTFANGNYLDKYFQVSEQAAAAYFRYVNDQGGVYGRKIDYVTCDTAGTADGTQGCVRKLVNDDKVFALGPTTDFNVDTVMPFVSEQRIPWVGTAGFYTAEFENPFVFPSQIPARDVGGLIATFTKQKFGVATVGVSYLNDVGGPDCTQRVEDVGKNLGFRVVAKIGNQQIEGDLTGKVLEMRSKNPDAVLFCNDPINTVKFIQAAGRTGYKPPSGWIAGFVAADDVPQSAGEAGVGMYGFTSFDFYKSDTPGIRRFRQITEHYYPQIFHHFYTQATYVGAVALVEAMTKAGPQLTRQKLLDAMRSMTDFDTGMGLRLNFGDVKATKSSGIMLQADAKLRWQVQGARFSLL